jgi:hypothetical protein
LGPPIFQSGRFTLVDRARLSTALSEVQLTQAGLTSPETAQRLKLIGVNIAVAGSITVFGPSELRVKLDAVNLATLEIQYTEIITASGTSDFPRVAKALVDGLARAFPTQGTIVEASKTSNQFFIDIGNNLGIKVGDEGKVLRGRKLGNGQVFNEAVGTFKVVGSDLRVSIIEVKSNSGQQVQVGDTVSFDVAAASSNINTNPQNNASLFISSNRPEGEIILNERSQGLVSSAGRSLSLAAGDYRLVLKAPGFEDYSQNLRLAANESRSVQAVLRPLTATLQIESEPSGATVIINGQKYGPTPMSVPGLVPGRVSYTLQLAGYEDLPGIAEATTGNSVRVFGKLNAKASTVNTNGGKPLGNTLAIQTLGRGDAEDIIIEGNLAYLASQGGLNIFDISVGGKASANIAEWREVGFLDLPATVKRMAKRGNFVYLASNYAGLFQVNVSDPQKPELVADIAMNSEIADIQLNDQFGAVLSAAELLVFDLTSLKVLGRQALPADSSAQKMLLQKDQAYVALGPQGLWLFALKNLAKIEATKLFASEWWNDIILSDGVFYASESNRIRSFRLADNQKDLQDLGTIDYAARLKVVGKRLYALSDSYFRIIDNSDPARLRELGRIELRFALNNLALLGDQAIIAGGIGGVRSIDISNPRDLIETSSRSAQGAITDLLSLGQTPAGDEWLLAAQRGSLQLYSLGQRPDSLPQRRWLMPWPCERLARFGNAVALLGWEGLRLVDISDPLTPQSLWTLDGDTLRGTGDGGIYSLVMDENYVYLGLNNGRLVIVDRKSQKMLPVVKLGWDGAIFDLKFYSQNNERYLLAANLEDGLTVFSLKTPQQPTVVANIKQGLVGQLSRLTIRDQTIFASDLYRGVSIISLADPQKPKLLGRGDGVNLALGAVVVADTLYVADQQRGVAIYDIRDPQNLRRQRTLPTSGEPYMLLVLGNRLLIADDVGGLTIAVTP